MSDEYGIKRCVRKNGSCYGCRTLREHVSYECPKVRKALDESVRKLGQLTRHENARVTYGNMNE